MATKFIHALIKEVKDFPNIQQLSLIFLQYYLYLWGQKDEYAYSLHGIIKIYR